MKLLFSEAPPDYAHYMFPYAVWAFPDSTEQPSDLFAAGFLPSSRDLDRFYLCRQVRIDLSQFALTSENRRVLRKGNDVSATLLPRSQFEFTENRRQAFKQYADIKFGKDVMTWQRLDQLLDSRLVSHLIVFTDSSASIEVGSVTLFLEPPRTAFYYYAFYDLAYCDRNLGMFMMTWTAQHFAQAGYHHLYLGTVYSRNALYKTQFKGAEFFNGVTWTPDLKQLKHLLERDQSQPRQHLLDCPDFLERYYPQGLASLARQAGFQATLESQSSVTSDQ